VFAGGWPWTATSGEIWSVDCFPFITGKLEDAAALAAEGQGSAQGLKDLASLSSAIRAGAEEAALLAEAAGALVSEKQPS
jgi:hypothetical protein